jgi:hypothetical protein
MHFKNFSKHPKISIRISQKSKMLKIDFRKTQILKNWILKIVRNIQNLKNAFKKTKF